VHNTFCSKSKVYFALLKVVIFTYFIYFREHKSYSTPIWSRVLELLGTAGIRTWNAAT